MVPKLRFSFTSALLHYKLGVLTKWSSGGTPSKDNKSYWDGDISWFTAASMKDNELSVSPTKISDLGLANGSRLANKNDILLLVRGSMLFNKIPVGVLLNDAAFNQDVKAIKCLEKINHRFALQWLLSKESHLLSMVTGTGIGAGKLDTSELQNLDVYLPDHVEQSKIADFLSSVDEKITLMNQQYDLLCQYKKGMMQKVFSQELRFKDENGEEFSEWELKQLSEIAIINPKNKEIPSEFIYIDLESVEKGMLLKKQLINKDNAPSRAQRLLVPGDVLFQLVRPYQKNNYIFLLDGDYVASTGYAQLRAKYNSLFLYQLLHLESFTSEVMNRCTGTSYPAINSSDLASIEVEIPCEKEQTKIANVLSALDDKIAVKKVELDKLKIWKQGLLQKMFI